MLFVVTITNAEAEANAKSYSETICRHYVPDSSKTTIPQCLFFWPPSWVVIVSSVGYGHVSGYDAFGNCGYAGYRHYGYARYCNLGYCGKF